MKHWISLLAVSFIASIALVGCAKDVEPQANAEKPAEEKTEENKPGPLKTAPEDGDDVAVLETGMGKIVVMFFPERAPMTVDNFKNLATNGFYNGTRFHRCIADFMIQGGDPNSKDLDKAASWGMGGNVVEGVEKTLPNEVNDVRHLRGVLSMANSGAPETASSQFFIVQKDSAHLDGGYTAFGKVVEGMDIVDKIVATGDPADNGKVEPKNAVLLKSVSIEKWPLSGAAPAATESTEKAATGE